AAVPRRFERSWHRGWWRPDWLAGHVRLELRNVVANYPFEGSHRFPVIIPAAETIRGRAVTVGGAARTSCHGSWQDACAAVGRRGASPSWQELPRSATPIAKIGSKGPPDRAARTLPQPNS